MSLTVLRKESILQASKSKHLKITIPEQPEEALGVVSWPSGDPLLRVL